MPGFPPQPVFPTAIDSDRTLYLVYNTSETFLAADNEPWSDEILIVPQPADKDELWADNGFANVSGELLYYDSVEKNANDRVYKLKCCLRNLGGSHTQYNTEGTYIRGFVLAEHHNQIVETIIAVEQFLGVDVCVVGDDSTLFQRLCNLQLEPDCLDDGQCPTIDFSYDIVSEDPCAGTVISYDLEIAGTLSTFRLDFGDGAFTTSTSPGTHLYAPNSRIDPTASASNSFCQVVVTGVQREFPDQPTIEGAPDPLLIPIVELPTIPDITIPEIPPVDFDFQFPPIVQPCIDLSPLSIPIISIGDIDIQVPSVISIVPPIPTEISVIPPVLTPIFVIPPILTPISIIPPSLSPISLIVPSLSPISLIGSIPSQISIVGTIPSTISLIGSPGNISVEYGTPPKISVEYGTPPTLSCTVSVTCPDSCPSATPFAPPLGMMDDEALNAIEIDYDFVGIPSVINVVAPEISFADHKLPTRINIVGPNIPSVIEVKSDFPKYIEVSLTKPEINPIVIDASSLPKAIKLESDFNIPSEISLIGASIPSVISIDGSGIPDSIQVEGIPKTIEVSGFPSEIPLVIKDPEVEMVYKGAPIDVVVKLELQNILGQTEDGYQCVAIVPCPKK